ncbi:glycosyltransferase family 4 protein [Candidatus Woesearchaeota archaeon]|nr:glycosyltransferase family 4 protein [Candidatus Woesearchaeota archaeon]
MMRITIITEYFPYSQRGEIRGGVEARCFYLGQELAKRHKVTVITSWQKETKRKDTIAGMAILRVGPHHRYTHKGYGAFVSRLRFAKAAKAMAARVPADVIDGTNFISYLPAFAAAKKQGIPAMATYHEVWVGAWIKNKGLVTGSLGTIWERLVLTKPWDRIIAVSEFTKQKLLAHGIPAKRIAVIPNGIDALLYQGSARKEKNPTICCVSRLTPQKRVEDLLRAFTLVKKELPHAQCIIIGTGDEEVSLKQLAKTLGVSSSVQFLGFVREHKRVMQYLKRSHVFCLPSVMEGFGITILEAMACGVPYVCTDIKPLQEITHQGKGGFLCRQKDPHDLAAKLLQLLTDKRVYAQKARECRQYGRMRDWKRLAKEVEVAYQKGYKNVGEDS